MSFLARCSVVFFFQAPTERQLRYKEKVAELRKKRNSGLSKEQKEKYMVRKNPRLNSP
jgi:hypothetical protein